MAPIIEQERTIFNIPVGEEKVVKDGMLFSRDDESIQLTNLLGRGRFIDNIMVKGKEILISGRYFEYPELVGTAIERPIPSSFRLTLKEDEINKAKLRVASNRKLVKRHIGWKASL